MPKELPDVWVSVSVNCCDLSTEPAVRLDAEQGWDHYIPAARVAALVEAATEAERILEAGGMLLNDDDISNPWIQDAGRLLRQALAAYREWGE